MSDIPRDTLEDILKDAGFYDGITQPAIQNYILSGSGFDWFVDPDTHTMVRIQRGTEIIPVDNIPDDNDKIIVRILHRFILVNKDEVQEIGFN